MLRAVGCVFALCSSLVAWADPGVDEQAPAVESEQADEPKEAWQRDGFGFGGIPAVNFSSDEGVGFGAAFTIYKYDGKTEPYKSSVDVLLFGTLKNIHHHRIKYDFLELAGGNLRISGRVKFEASKVENYCGLGGAVTCDPAVAEADADRLELTGDDRDEHVRLFYRSRYVMPYGIINARWMLSDKPHRISLMGGYRINYMLPGDLGTTDNYAGSLYDQEHPDGERGAVSVLQFGVQADNRRNEAGPYSGYLAEASVRASSKYWGSNPDWQYVAFTLKGQGYLPLGKDDGHLVLAQRAIFDGLAGNTSTQDLTWAGGEELLTMGGNQDSGRGVRQRRYKGKVKALSQTELRFRYARVNFGSSTLDFGVLAFADLGLTGLEWQDFGKDAPFFGTGGGLRFTLNQNFVIRVDMGASKV
ncbi:MAG: hypothetical protein ACI9MC_003658, partial [Kiritimatiellia bacterium]